MLTTKSDLGQGHGEAVPVRDEYGMVEAGLVEVGEGQLPPRHLHHHVVGRREEPLTQLLHKQLRPHLVQRTLSNMYGCLLIKTLFLLI